MKLSPAQIAMLEAVSQETWDYLFLETLFSFSVPEGSRAHKARIELQGFARSVCEKPAKPATPVRLSEPQRYMLSILAGMNPIRRPVCDGTFMPYASERRIVDALEHKGLVKWAHTGKEGYIYNGIVLTDAGRKAIADEKGAV